MHTGIFASTITERTAALKEKVAHRQTGIAALNKSVDDAKRALTATMLEEARLKQALADTIGATDASADAMRNQLQEPLVITTKQTEQRARLNVEKDSSIEQFDALRARYEHLFKILMDKLKVLQFKALEDAETIERLQFQLDELNEKSLLAEFNAKPPISTATMGTQTDVDATPTRDSSTEPNTTAGLAARSTPSPSPSPAGRTGGGNTAKTSPPLRKNITLLEKKEVGLSSDAWMRLWGTQTLDQSAQVLHCQQGILAIQNWKKGSEPEGSIQAMVNYLNTYAKSALKVPKLTKKTITTNVDDVCKTQEEAHVTPSQSPSRDRPFQSTRGKLGGNFSKNASPSPDRTFQSTRRKQGDHFQNNASPSARSP